MHALDRCFSKFLQSILEKKCSEWENYTHFTLRGQGRLWLRRADGFFFLTRLSPLTAQHWGLLAAPAESWLSNLLSSWRCLGLAMGIPERIRVEAPGLGNFCFAFCEVPLEPGCSVVDCVGFWRGCWQGLDGQTPVHLRVLHIQPDCKAVDSPLL